MSDGTFSHVKAYYKLQLTLIAYNIKNRYLFLVWLHNSFTLIPLEIISIVKFFYLLINLFIY